MSYLSSEYSAQFLIWRVESNTPYPISKLYCEFCQSKKERKIIKELCKSVADSLDFYDFEEDLTRGGKLK